VSAERAGRRWPVAAAVALFVVVAGSVQFGLARVPQDADTAYHAAVGRLIRHHGILHAFPWTPFSWLADHYGDKELLLHLGFAALAGLDWVAAAQVVGTVAGALLLLALYLVLRAERVPLPWLWALLPLVASDVFLYRFALVRPHLLSIALALAVLWAAAAGRLRLLAVLSALYPWCYVAWFLPLVLAGLAGVARLAVRERFRWGTLGAAAAGAALGLALHPNTANLVRFTWLQIGDVLFQRAWGGAQGFELGLEFQPFSAAQWLRWMLAATTLALAGTALAWRSRRAVAIAFALGALAFGALTLRTARFAEYFVPFSVAAFALASRELRWSRWAAPAALAACALYSGPALVETARGLRDHPDPIPPELAARMQAIPVGAQVFTCEWGMTGRLMLALPDRRFMVALDPTLFHARDPELYQLWYQLPRAAPPNSAELVRDRFGARYVICSEDFQRFNNAIAVSRGASTLALSEHWGVYALGR
jgi:hypothetical protein